MNYIDKLSIKEWALEDRPREKLLKNGLGALSNAELLAILIGSGTKDESAVDLCKRLLSQNENNLNELGKRSISDLTKLKGIGPAKALTIIAAMELGRRRKDTESIKREKIKSSEDVFTVMKAFLSDLPHEEFWVLLLNRANKIMDKQRVSIGGISGTVTDIRIILKLALDKLASSIIVCHNHPSGNKLPSEPDRIITKKLKEAAQLLDVQLLDHIIIADQKYYSFADNGEL